ncbi:hypothetical protein [Paratractidigestivibacter sp.]|uniref:hypothetical protein n=1 Tax=Paratractidigestivibacter sp. TaxID=2847316 RepID=UPI002ABE3542|nr:hypothetical protein [Paratractidigestivibacter sp.]
MFRKNLNESQRKVYDACCNGWFIGGEYRAMFDNHERRFYADSVRWLYDEVNDWFESHSDRHAGSPIVVQCLA